MPQFGKRSTEKLSTAHPDLQRLFNEVIKHVDCAVIEGHRGEAAQNEAVKHGMSKLKWPDSPHNKQPSQAVDVCPYPVDWTNFKAFYHFAGFVRGVAAQMGIKIRWGGDWDSDFDIADQRFFDLPHFELVSEMPSATDKEVTTNQTNKGDSNGPTTNS